jgi:GNAT superfamily N-acetyltransferase
MRPSFTGFGSHRRFFGSTRVITPAIPPMTIQNAETDEQIAATFNVMHQLRPHLTRDEYVPLVRGLMASDGFRLAALTDEGRVRAVAGYRFMSMLYCGRLLYLDDLVSDERARSRGYGKALLDWLKDEARREGCSELQLISHTKREGAHRFYFRENFGIQCFHFRTQLEQGGDG